MQDPPRSREDDHPWEEERREQEGRGGMKEERLSLPSPTIFSSSPIPSTLREGRELGEGRCSVEDGK